VKLAGDLGHRAGARHRLLDDRAAPHVAGVLTEVTDDDASVDHHLTSVRLLLAHDHPKDRGFPRAVRADEPDALTPEKTHRRVDEEQLLAVLLGDRVEPNHGRERVTCNPFASNRRGTGEAHSESGNPPAPRCTPSDVVVTGRSRWDFALMKRKNLLWSAPLLAVGFFASSARADAPTVDEGFSFQSIEWSGVSETGGTPDPKSDWTIKASYRIWGTFPARSVLRYVVKQKGKALGEVRCETRSLYNATMKNGRPHLFSVDCTNRNLKFREPGQYELE